MLPNINLIENVGFGADATHTTGESEFANLKADDIIVAKHPLHVEVNQKADEYTSHLMFRKKPFFMRAVNKMIGFIK